MAVDAGEIRWYSPDPRGILPLERFRVSRRLSRLVRQGRFEIRVDHDFTAVINACADRPDDDGSWIDEEIVQSYCALHRHGFAHSVETWQGGALVGGLYGVALGGAFFGESMFHRVTDASKVACWATVELLRLDRAVLFDVQWTTPHLRTLGAIDLPRSEYLRRLRAAVASAA
jgi:leucyl/phenylalanyl-tRNA--protein transferase